MPTAAPPRPRTCWSRVIWARLARPPNRSAASAPPDARNHPADDPFPPQSTAEQEPADEGVAVAHRTQQEAGGGARILGVSPHNRFAASGAIRNETPEASRIAPATTARPSRPPLSPHPSVVVFVVSVISSPVVSAGRSARHRAARLNDGRAGAAMRSPSAGGMYPASAQEKLCPGGTISSIRSNTSSLNTTSMAPIWPARCSAVRGPMIALVTAGWLMTNASAMWINDSPDSSASSASASAASSLARFSGSDEVVAIGDP